MAVANLNQYNYIFIYLFISQTVVQLCMVNHVGNINTPLYTYSTQNVPLQNVVTAVKDMDVLFDFKLKFNVHIKNIVVKTRARSNLIIKCFLSRDPKLFYSGV